MSKGRRKRLGIALFLVAAVTVTASCGNTVNGAAQTTRTQSAQIAGTHSHNGCTDTVAFDPANFPQVPRIDNPWLPLTPNTRLVLEGHADRGEGRQTHQVIFTVTDLVKVIDGVPNVVVWDRDIQDGDLAEAELAFFAQDLAGNVWNLGEYPEEYDGGQFEGAPSTWFSGHDDAYPGIHMKANPQAGSGWYLQGTVPSIKFLDCARITGTDTKACVPLKCFDSVVATDETSPLDKGNGIQRKYNARGVGVIQVGAVGGAEGEILRLTEYGALTPKERKIAHASALALERHAYRSNRLYQETQAAK